MLPYVPVSHLASSASFYSAVTHPLGLRYLEASSTSVVYGVPTPTDPPPTLPVFELIRGGTRSADTSSKRSRLVLSAASPSVVSDFRAAALRAHPNCLDLIGEDPYLQRPADPASGETRAKIQDHDGNTMEVVYLKPSNYPANHRGDTVRRTQSTTDEVSRILSWNRDVATADPPQSVAGPVALGAKTALTRRRPLDDDTFTTVLRKSVTTSTVEAPPRRESKGFNTTAVVGTVLGAVVAGVAIGGALSYMNSRRERELAPQHDFEPPMFQRRSTYPDPYPDQHRPRYIEVERTVEKIRYPEEYPPTKSRYYPPPSYMARYSQAGARPRELEELDDRESRYSSRHSRSGRHRTQSEAGASRRPLMITDVEYRSTASKHSSSSKTLVESEQRRIDSSRRGTTKVPSIEVERRSHVSRHSSRHSPDAEYRGVAPSKHSVTRSIRHLDPEIDSWVSVRSKRTDGSENTIRPPRITEVGPPIVDSMSRVKGPSRHMHSHPTVQVPVQTRAVSHSSSARKQPLPPSQTASIYDEWDDDEDDDSIAPSDSISCVGTKRSSRSRR